MPALSAQARRQGTEVGKQALDGLQGGGRGMRQSGQGERRARGFEHPYTCERRTLVDQAADDTAQRSRASVGKRNWPLICGAERDVISA